MSGHVRRITSRIGMYWRVLTRGRQLSSEIRDEMQFHVEMETERLIRERQLSPVEARRQAMIAFGGVEKYNEAGRDVHGLRWLEAILQDSRFSVRMLLKHRGLTIVGVFAMAVAIAVGATMFEVLSELLDPSLPFAGGDRVISIHFTGTSPSNPERRVIHEFAALRDQLTTVEQFGGFVDVEHNLVAANTAPEPVHVAATSATAFAITGIQPLLGR